MFDDIICCYCCHNLQQSRAFVKIEKVCLFKDFNSLYLVCVTEGYFKLETNVKPFSVVFDFDLISIKSDCYSQCPKSENITKKIV